MAGPASGTPSDTAALPGGLVAAVRPLDGAAPWVPAWRALGRASLVRNPFYEAGYALAARDAFGAGVRLLLVADRPPEAAGARLVAAWPFRPSRRRWGVPLPLLMGWTHGYAPFGAPLLDGTAPEAALAGLLAAPGALGLPPRLLLPNAPADGPLPELLAARGGRRAAFWPHDRGLLDLTGLGPEARAAYLGHLSGQRRRKLRRARARLEAAGPVTFDILAAPDALGPALEAHVALEAAGWKGEAGTSLAQRPAEVAFLRAALADLSADLGADRGAADGVRIARLRRGDRLLASLILPVTGREAWVLKIANDETRPETAPGVQLVHRLTEAVAAGDWPIDRIDSCAPPGFALGTTFWSARRPIAHLLVEAGRDPLFPVARILERAREGVARARVTIRSGRSAPAAPASPPRRGP
ncbi:CelD/BcsL family acetyltransferase involved in cellulose biosynthesis [Methylobacterium sp. PvP062]|uniref:CelD/BcsL family acetyltransferase involved in cellulose biosynthesis n=1 Tax=Methylobacterium radiotolerans TaxID=31998 RepID=A0ABV2NGA2_9HYPH|nr:MULTISPECIES: GNAT family N-acetyltransferase [Methylobacterium]MCX7335049.1 GNAT family N-acetyltransferase [Hyphomicrobiales bacterium]KTS50938.1 acetyltransferase (GNAT) domain-containing protein [Methylobacterium radiotolerans]MBP2497740.1 CelD/BcsL family acetyltransferase involved in cellulose biosynthesis [Methylobacterium sp. PvP105]MBP2502389.1 CelD/BcsL family acetyltransferase involved in cellulose biosynthesis [Methylobacterium sp. PvP109]MDE3747418.1 GNAT family N-acetyltransfe